VTALCGREAERRRGWETAAVIPSKARDLCFIWKQLKMVTGQELHQLLCAAIENKRLTRFRYKNNERIVEPHDYGIQNGIVRLFCWQVGGRSSGRIPGWRMIDVEGIQDCELMDKRFAGNREVQGKHHRWDEVFIRVAPPEKK
jgi:hypothetical protein